MSAKIDYSKGHAGFISYMEPAWWDTSASRVKKTILTVEDALKEGGLDFHVEKLPNRHHLPSGEIIISNSSFFTYRTDTNQILGDRLGSIYTVYQNNDALALAEDMLKTGKVTIETAGSIDGGKRVFICLKLSDPIRVSGKDEIFQYVLIANGHDGSLSIVLMPTNVRVVCNNTLSAALAGATGSYKIRHTVNAPDRLKELATVMGILTDNKKANEAAYNAMKATVITQQDFFDYIGNIFLTGEEITKLQKGDKDAIGTKKKNIISSVIDFANTGIGQQEAIGNNLNMWWAYNAITGSLTGKKYSDADDRMNSLIFGDSAKKIQRAGELALNTKDIRTLKLQGSDNINLN